jgi:hypothetical protein
LVPAEPKDYYLNKEAEELKVDSNNKERNVL